MKRQSTGRRTVARMDTDRPFMGAAKAQAAEGMDEGGIPIGAVLVVDGRVLGAGRNRRVQRGSPILHGETDALVREMVHADRKQVKRELERRDRHD